ncbi:uncharacterized protein LOC126728199 [Quercus robur]|uniref:uncharacterized protein LOC126728199 n=1 Tax=Quercus robur TaxID=38942 RepID=UPI002161D4C4|nr:uncharacterized protein LOC126728199 [Quercus robur]
MWEGETLKTYFDRYWEIFNEIDGDFDDLAIRTFKVGLPAEHDLRKSLTRKSIRSVHQLMDRIDEYKRVEKDEQQGEGKAKVVLQDRMDFRSNRTSSKPSRVLFIVQPFIEDLPPDSKRSRVGVQPVLSFSDEDKAGTLQPHDDALVVTLKIGGYDVKRVLVDQGNGAKIMYPDLFRGLKLRPNDLTCYDSPLIGFDGKIVFPRSQIRLPIQAGSEVVEIPLALGDQKKTSFVKPIENYHYKVMPFGLKNVESTYQRMMTRMFKPQLGKNIEVYIDDMVVKRKVESEHINDLGDIFEILRKHKLRLNATKYSFGLGSGKFLGYMVTHYEIEVDPD